MNTCPYCGLPLPVIGGGWERRDYHTFELAEGSAIQQALPAGADWERRRPARAASLRSDVGVPATQASITGLLAGGAAGAIAAAAGSPHTLAIGAIAGVGTTGLTWLILLSSHRKLLWEIETITGTDLDGDGDAGPPDALTPIEIHIPADGQRGAQVRYPELPATPDQLRQLARGLMAGRPLSESAWSGKGRPFSKAAFLRLRDELLERRLAVWRNSRAHAQGVELTAIGRAMFQRLAEG